MRTIKKGVVCHGGYERLNYVTGEKLEAIEQVEYCIVIRDCLPQDVLRCPGKDILTVASPHLGICQLYH